MRSDFVTVFESLNERLDMYFHTRLKRAGRRFDIEYWKGELIQETAVATIQKLRKEKYNDYSLTELIFVKAKDIWIEHVKKMRKQQGKNDPLDEKIIDTRKTAFINIDAKDELRQLEKMADPDSWKMLVMFSNGYNYREIAAHFCTTEAAVKMRVARLKNKLNSEK